jgi:predicted transcriptional regulator
MPAEASLSRRERQIMDILFAMGRATGQEVGERLPGNPSYSTVRTLLRILERKGHIRHAAEGLRYVYEPSIAPVKARQSAIQRLVTTFFDGSMKAAAAAFLDPKTAQLSPEDLKELEQMIRRMRKENQRKENQP